MKLFVVIAKNAMCFAKNPEMHAWSKHDDIGHQLIVE